MHKCEQSIELYKVLSFASMRLPHSIPFHTESDVSSDATVPFHTESDVSSDATVALTPNLEPYKCKRLVHTARETHKCEQSIEIYTVLSFASMRLSHQSTHLSCVKRVCWSE